MKQDADWVGWSLQFMAGLLLGALLGSTLGIGRLSNRWQTDPAAATALLCGSALLCAGQASLRGDRFWYGRGFRAVSTGDRIRHNKSSRTASALISVIGAASIAGGFICHLLAISHWTIRNVFPHGIAWPT